MAWYLTAMPNENDTKTATPTASAVDPRDLQLADLERKIDALKAENTALKAKPRAAAAPAGDYCVLSGKTYTVSGLVSVREATDQGRKGYIDLESDLVILKR